MSVSVDFYIYTLKTLPFAVSNNKILMATKTKEKGAYRIQVTSTIVSFRDLYRQIFGDLRRQELIKSPDAFPKDAVPKATAVLLSRQHQASFYH